MKSVVFVLVFCLVHRASSSAIPMWEFLSRDEKMSHLYRVFNKQVTKYCSNSPQPDCSKNLMMTGVRNLVNLDNDGLDELDPYQHTAKDIIWRRLSNNAFAPKAELDNSFNSNEAEPTGMNDADNNRLTRDLEEAKSSVNFVKSEEPSPILIGPLVVRVLPDGRPVPGDEQTPAPKDDDLEDLRVEKIPFVEQMDRKNRRPVFAPVLYRKPVMYSKNMLANYDYPRRSENPRFYGHKEIPRFRRFFVDFDYIRRAKPIF